MRIGIFLAVCKEDWEWVKQFKKQAEILGYDVAWFADKLNPDQLLELTLWKNTVFVHDNQTQVFSERSKEYPYRYFKENGYDWAIQMDVDETWQEGAKELIEQALEENPDGFVADCPMVTVFKGDVLQQRVDEYFTTGTESSRWRIYNLKYEWHWNNHITCGAYVYINGVSNNTFKAFPCKAHSVHWGYWTHELMGKHKEKWDKVYTRVHGFNPYSDTAYKYINKEIQFDTIPLEDKYYKHL
jgi:hypothetical protein